MRCKAQIHRIFEQDSMLLKEDYQNIFSTPFPKKMQVIAHDFLMKSQVHLFGCRNVGSTFEKVKVKSLGLVRLLRTDPIDCSPPGSSVCGILQARILGVAISFSRRSSQHRNRTRVSCIADRRFTVCSTREATFENITSKESDKQMHQERIS